jgi:cell division protease FtsH
VEKRPRITAFDDFGVRTPSEKPPIKTRRELAHERGEVLPPEEDELTPAEVGSGVANGYGDAPGTPGASPFPAGGSVPSRPDAPNDGGYAPGDGGPGHGGGNGGNGNGNGYGAPGNGHGAPVHGHGRAGSYGGPGQPPPPAVAPNYGAPPDWRPATTPQGQSWPPPNWAQPPQQGGPQGPAQGGPWPGRGPGGGNGNGAHGNGAPGGANDPGAGEQRRGHDPEAGH